MEMSNITICRHSMTTINVYIVYIQTNISPLISMQSHLQNVLDFSNLSFLDLSHGLGKNCISHTCKVIALLIILFTARILSSNLSHHETEDFAWLKLIILQMNHTAHTNGNLIHFKCLRSNYACSSVWCWTFKVH